MEMKGTPTNTIRGVVRLPAGATRVTDADEEVFLLYTDLAAHRAADGTSGFRGLGHIDSHKDILTITLNLAGRITQCQEGDTPQGKFQKPRGARKRKVRRRKEDETQTLEVEIVQDKTALRSRKGDTGSVLWHASVDFAETILQQLHHAQHTSFFDMEHLSRAHVLELGAGTGLLGVVLSPFVQHYTVTDIEELVPLIRKNLARNMPITQATSPQSKHSPIQPSSNVTATALNWVELHSAPPSLRPKLVPSDPTDLLLVVDCIYHPSLLPALLTTIDYLTIEDRTAVVVVVELRAEDVVREFLQGWLDMTSDGDWEIWSISGLLEGPYAIWVGWKGASPGGVSE